MFVRIPTRGMFRMFVASRLCECDLFRFHFFSLPFAFRRRHFDSIVCEKNIRDMIAFSVVRFSAVDRATRQNYSNVRA